MATHLQAHPLADAFPLIEGAEFDELVQSIRQNGLRHPVILFEGMILDGRNRYRACLEAGVTPLTQQFTGRDPVAFVIDENVHRRHLTTSQRAMIAAKIATLRQGDNSNAPIGALSQRDAASSLNVSRRTVQRAGVILDHGTPEQIRAVEQGAASVDAISKDIRPSPERRAARNKSSQDRKTETQRIKAQIWSDLRTAMQLLSGLPAASDTADIARAMNRSGLLEKHLPHALNWLKEFNDAYSNSKRNSDAA